MPIEKYSTRKRLKAEALVRENPKKYQHWQSTQPGMFADTTHHGVQRIDGKRSRKARQAGYSTRQWKKGRVAGGIAAGSAVLGAGLHLATRDKRPQQQQLPGYGPMVKAAYVEPESRGGYNRGDVRFKDDRYDEIEAKRLKRVYPQLVAADAAAGAGPVLGTVGVAQSGLSVMSERKKRGVVSAQSSEGAGPKGIGGQVGVRRRSMVRSAAATAGEEDSPIRVVRRSKRKRDQERASATVKPLVTGGAVAAGLLALKNPKVRDRVEEGRNIARDWKSLTRGTPGQTANRILSRPIEFARNTTAGQAAEKGVRVTARTAYKHPGKAAALAAATGLGAAVYGNRREPDTHEIKFVHPKAKDRAKK